MNIVEFKKTLAAALYLYPMTIDEMIKLSWVTYPDWMLDRILQRLENENWIYFKNKTEKYHTYKHIAERKLKEFEL